MDDIEVAEETHAAYPVTADVGKPQCSQHPDTFCFFCEYAGTSAETGSDIDLRGTLVSLVTMLHREKREIAHIVDSVHERYVSSIQHHIPGTPEWGRTSIRRHLLYSTEFTALFTNVVTQVFQTIIHSLNETMMDDDNHVIEQNRRAFVDTVKAYQQWKKGEDQHKPTL